MLLLKEESKTLNSKPSPTATCRVDKIIEIGVNYVEGLGFSVDICIHVLSALHHDSR